MDAELTGCFDYIWSKIPSPFELDADLLPEETNYFTAPFNRARQDQWVFFWCDLYKQVHMYIYRPHELGIVVKTDIPP